MIIEVGKFYRTRNGKKACVYNNDGTDRWPFDFIVIGSSSTLSCRASGHVDRDGTETPEDLVADWSEPNVAYLNAYPATKDKPARLAIAPQATAGEADAFALPTRVARVRVEWQPGQFDD